MKTKKISIHGLRHRFYYWGNPKKPKILFLHGWMDTGASFAFVAEFLKKDFYCIAFDWRGYGQSEPSKNPLGYFFFEYWADLHEIIKKLSPRKKINIVGHSMGGAIASVYAGMFPERVERFVNIEGFTPIFSRNISQTKRLRLWLEESNLKRFKTYKTREEIAERFRKSNPQLSLERARFLLPYTSEKTKGGWMISADPRHKLIDPYPLGLESSYVYWKSIESPGLFDLAEQTQQVESQAQGELKRLLEQRLDHLPASCRIELMPGASHMIHHEKPKELAEMIVRFLTQ